MHKQEQLILQSITGVIIQAVLRLIISHIHIQEQNMRLYQVMVLHIHHLVKLQKQVRRYLVHKVTMQQTLLKDGMRQIQQSKLKLSIQELILLQRFHIIYQVNMLN